MKRFNGLFSVSLVAMMLLMTGCFKKQGNPTAYAPGAGSTKTGIDFDRGKGKSTANGAKAGFAVREFAGQPEGPDLVFIEGGRVILGSFEEDIMNSRDNLERTVTVASFYMDQTEVANIHWLEYLYYALDSGRGYYESVLPDTTVWARELAYNDPYVDHYLRYPGFRYFPVVGVNWLQAQKYCVWRSTMVNRQLALDNGTDAEVQQAQSGGRIPLESGVVLPQYRLPSEAEWEYAAQALIGVQYNDENHSHRRIYPWNGHSLRNPYGAEMGTFLANFKRGRGDYAGIAGRLNDGAMITAWIYDNPPNDFGLYNMAGNVNEWVEDLYRPLSFRDFEDLNPIRKDGFLDDDNYGYIYNRADWETFIGPDVRVYKGGSWKDVAYWLSPGTRRYLQQDSSTATIGFRCAMIRAGSNY